jgi:hypothetical protein
VLRHDYERRHLGSRCHRFKVILVMQSRQDRSGNDSVTIKDLMPVQPHERFARHGGDGRIKAGVWSPLLVTGSRPTTRNDESVVALVSYGDFRAAVGGDLSGFKENSYRDIESSVAPKVDQVDVYTVHHHGSRYSMNTARLQTVNPQLSGERRDITRGGGSKPEGLAVPPRARLNFESAPVAVLFCARQRVPPPRPVKVVERDRRGRQGQHPNDGPATTSLEAPRSRFLHKPALRCGPYSVAMRLTGRGT